MEARLIDIPDRYSLLGSLLIKRAASFPIVEGKKYLGPHKVLDDLRNLLSRDQTVPLREPHRRRVTQCGQSATPPHLAERHWSQVFKKPPP